MLAIIKDLERSLAGLRRGRVRVHVPKLAGLFRRKPRAFFHPAPELFLQTGGATDFECPGGSFRLGTGEMCVMPAGVPHAETPVDLQTPYAILVCMQTRDGLLFHRAHATAKREITTDCAEHLPSPRARSAFRYLEEISGDVREKHRRQFAKNLLEVFLIAVLSEISRPSAADDLRSPLIAETEKLARALLADPGLSIARLAATLGYSADYLSRQFHQERGSALKEWIIRERIALARDLLEEPRYSVAEVGWMCGFNAASYFIRVFRHQTGFTPKAWRSLARQRGS
ncbi:MAG TPA: AraC family transcriptional regulator [Terrimicrobiaceae bacterium]|nr:AraC family transcriptional regulator [Terrimicrobiaceae bacterium]